MVIDTVCWLGVTLIILVVPLNRPLSKRTTMTNLYRVIMPLGIAGCLQLNVTSVLVGMEIKFCGASSGPIKLKSQSGMCNSAYIEMAQIVH